MANCHFSQLYNDGKGIILHVSNSVNNHNEIEVVNCTFDDLNNFCALFSQTVHYSVPDYRASLLIKNLTANSITSKGSCVIQIRDMSVCLEGPIIFSNITTQELFRTDKNIFPSHGLCYSVACFMQCDVTFKNYIEFSKNKLHGDVIIFDPLVLNAILCFIKIERNTFINITNSTVVGYIFSAVYDPRILKYPMCLFSIWI